MFDSKIAYNVLYNLGGSELVDLDEVGDGSTGLCQHREAYHKNSR